MTRPHVSNRLSAFTEHGLVEKIENGRYQLSDLGHAYLEGQLDADDLEATDE
ncbi:PhiH1 repressor-like protein [Natrinema sp. J7-2]|nr:PhiH1 repressor-like protein [Natrinema sp. J7-2]